MLLYSLCYVVEKNISINAIKIIKVKNIYLTISDVAQLWLRRSDDMDFIMVTIVRIFKTHEIYALCNK